MLQSEIEGVSAEFVRITKQPDLIKFGTMRPYQLESLNWMAGLYHNGMNGILADEMGLGKTLQSIAILAHLNEHQNVKGKYNTKKRRRASIAYMEKHCRLTFL